MFKFFKEKLQDLFKGKEEVKEEVKIKDKGKKSVKKERDKKK